MSNQIGKDLQKFQFFFKRLQIGIEKRSTNRFGYNRGQEGRRRLTLLEIASYSTMHSTQQWMEMSKSTTLEIDFGPMVIIRK
jgi:hypothetical protein